MSFDAKFWEQGIERKCHVFPGLTCIFEPCLVINDAKCCRECASCGNPCPRVRKEIGHEHRLLRQG